MFRETSCSSSGGQIILIQHLVSSLWKQVTRVHLKRRGRQFSRLLASEVCASAVVMLDIQCSELVWRVMATHSIRQLPLHFPSLRHRVPSRFNWTLQRVIPQRVRLFAIKGLDASILNKKAEKWQTICDLTVLGTQVRVDYFLVSYFRRSLYVLFSLVRAWRSETARFWSEHVFVSSDVYRDEQHSVTARYCAFGCSKTNKPF